MKPLTLFSKSTGLRTIYNSVREPYNSDTGVSSLAKAVNVRHDRTGRVISRNGYVKQYSGRYHSLFCDKGDCFVGESTYLYKVNNDLTLTGIRDSLAGTRLSYAQVEDKTYYCNGFQNGIIEYGVSKTWPLVNYVGPEVTTTFSAAPIGNHLAFAFARMFIGQGKTLWYSEMFNLSTYNLADCYINFKSDIRMILPVKEGIFVSDCDNIYFLKGTDPLTFEKIKLTNYPAIEWSAAIDKIEATKLGINMEGLCVLFVSTKGTILGKPDGSFENLTEHKVIYPALGTRGAGLITGDDFIHSLFF